MRIPVSQVEIIKKLGWVGCRWCSTRWELGVVRGIHAGGVNDLELPGGFERLMNADDG